MLEEASFGAWLKQRRKALDLTQDALAQHLGCSTETISKIERGERRPSRKITERLLECLQVAPEERPACAQQARREPLSCASNALIQRKSAHCSIENCSYQVVFGRSSGISES